MEKHGAVLHWRHVLCGTGAFVAEMEPRQYVFGGWTVLSSDRDDSKALA